ncbi:MAG: metallophosphoesterase [Gemmataceae bacterium]
MAALKLAFASDLNLTVTSVDALTALARKIAAATPSAVILAGDLAESLQDFTRVVQLFRRELTCPLWIVPGDVDFWARPPYDSTLLWKTLLPRAVADCGALWLEGKAQVLEGVAIAGSIGWYDYSAAGMAGMVSDPEFAQKKYLYNADALRIDWEYSDPEFAGIVSAGLLATLDHLQQDPFVQQIVVATHFPLLEQQLNRQANKGFACAYSANLTLGKKVLGYSKLTHLVSGHLRQERQGTVLRDDLPPVTYHVLPGDPERPSWLELTLDS